MAFKEWFKENIIAKAMSIINNIAANFENTNGNFDWHEVVNVFSRFCDGTLQGDMKQVVDEIVLNLNLQDEVSTIQSFWQKIPQSTRKLFTIQLKTQGATVTFDLLGAQGKSLNYGNIAGPLKSTINFGASANLTLGMTALTSTDTLPQSLGITCSDQERFLKIGMLGKLALEGGASLPLGFLGVSGSGSAQGTASLDYLYKDKADWFMVEALINNLPHLSSPFNGKDIAAESEHRLTAMQLTVQGQLNAAFGIEGSATWGTSFNVESKNLELDTDVTIGANMKIKYDADLELKGGWIVSVKPKNNTVLMVKVQKDTSKETNSTLSVGATLGISGLDEVGNAFLKKYMPDASEFISKLQPYLNFGSLLKDEVKEKLDDILSVIPDDSIKNQLIETLTGEAGASDLANALGTAAQTALNKKLELLTGKIDQPGKELVSNIVKELKLPGTLGDKLITTIDTKFDSLLGNIKSKLQGFLAKVISENQGKLTPLFKPLEKAGTTVENTVQDIDKKSQELVGPVLQYLNKYQQLRNKIILAIQKTSNLKLALQLGRIHKATSGDSALMEFEMDMSVPKAQEYYKQMLAGHFKHALVSGRVQPNGSDGIVLTGGSFKTYATDNLKTDFSLNLFGAQFKAETISLSEVQVELDTAGNVILASDKAELTRVVDALGEIRTLKFFNLMEIPGSTSGQTRVLNSGLTMSYKDKNMKKGEIDSYLGSLGTDYLISPQTFEAAVARYNQILEQAKAENKKMGAEIGLNLGLNSEDIKKLIATPDQEINSKAIYHQLNCFFTQKDQEGSKYKFFSSIVTNWGGYTATIYDKIREMGSYKFKEEPVDRYGTKNRDERVNRESIDISIQRNIHLAWKIGKNAEKLVEIIGFIREAANVQFTDANRKDMVKKLNQNNKQMSEYLKSWLKVKGFLSNINVTKESIPAPTLAFIATIGDICQLRDTDDERRAGTEFISPTIKWSVLDWKLEVFV